MEWYLSGWPERWSSSLTAPPPLRLTGSPLHSFDGLSPPLRLTCSPLPSPLVFDGSPPWFDGLSPALLFDGLSPPLRLTGFDGLFPFVWRPAPPLPPLAGAPPPFIWRGQSVQPRRKAGVSALGWAGVSALPSPHLPSKSCSAGFAGFVRHTA